MPIHDWTGVMAGVFHDFHNSWITHIKESLNESVLPEGYYALAEQYVGQFQPDVLALRDVFFAEDEEGRGPESEPDSAGVAVAEATPDVSVTHRLSESLAHVTKQKTISIRHRSNDETVALIEIVSPANKDRDEAVEHFIHKAYEALLSRIHLLIIDLFPPTRYDPDRLHDLLWTQFGGALSERTELPCELPLTLAAYEAGRDPCAYIEPTKVGNTLVQMPLFLRPGHYVNVPLEESYGEAYAGVPNRWKTEIEKSSSSK